MLFNSYQFLIFFPIVCLMYWLIPVRFRYIWLLAASYCFYMGWNAKYALLLLFSTVITYLSGIFISRVVVIDLYGLGSNNKVFENIDYVHNTLDAFPLSYNKVVAINDLFEDVDDKAEMLFPLAKYHGRWTGLNRDDFVIPLNTAAGFEFGMKVNTEAKAPQIVSADDYPTEYSISMEYAEKIIKLCQSKDIEVVLTFLPCTASQEQQIAANYGYVLAEKYNIKYLDLFKAKGLVNYNMDFADAVGHLNVSGSYKMTDVIGKYLVEHYDISENRVADEKQYNDYSAVYKTKYAGYLESQKNVNDYIMMLNNHIYDCEIYLNKNITETKYPFIYELISNTAGIREITVNSTRAFTNRTVDNANTEVDFENTDIKIIVYRKSDNAVVDTAEFKLQ